MDLRVRPVRGTRDGARLPIALLGVLLVICLATAYAPPAGRLNWALRWGRGSRGSPC